MIRRLFLCAAALLTSSATAFGQAKVIKVYVTGEGNVDTTEVAQMVRGRIGGTLRYSLTQSIDDADLGMEVIASPVGHEMRVQNRIGYFPPEHAIIPRDT
jgi:hypothetical protein